MYCLFEVYTVFHMNLYIKHIVKIEKKKHNFRHQNNTFIPINSFFVYQVFKTDMFKKFLEERMSDSSDYWSDLEMKTRRDIDSYTLTRR